LINRQIRFAYVRVIGKDGEQLGILDTRQATQLAESMGLDLVLVADKADPPVCKIMDYGKFKYEEKKKAQQAKKKQTVVELKEIQIRPKTESHDLEHKAKSAIGFLEDGDKAKITVVYRGREMEHLETGWETLVEFIEKLQDNAIIEAQPRLEGKRLACILAAAPKGKKLGPGQLVASLVKPHNVRNRTPFMPTPGSGSR
jgi:translation initiation factor IF-3